jgi:hypothetical protein
MNATNHEGVLQSFGMIGVTLQDAAGNKLNIMSGKSASITVPIAPAQQSSAPATIALWYFDDADGLWKEQGTATKNGNVYIGTVQHFTWWKCDVN